MLSLFKSHHIITTSFIFLFFGTLLNGCAGSADEAITIRGSDTMVALGQSWAEIYMIKFPEQTVQVNGGGSGTGIAALINRIADICQSSRPMKERERRLIQKKFGRDVIEIPVAKDGIVVYVHESNPINEISIQQLHDIYTGKIKNWKELGGEDQKLIAYSRENSSGTYEFFKKEVMQGDDFASEIQTLPGTGAVANAVSHEAKSIGYGGNAYSTGIKLLSLRATEHSEAILATAETIADGSYPLARDLYFYLVHTPTPIIADFIKWVLSDEGQLNCTAQGYFPVRPLSLGHENETHSALNSHATNNNK